LDFGTALTVVDAAPEWTEVALASGLRGYVSSALLTPEFLERDLDADGIPERIAVTFEADAVTVRVARGGELARHRVDLGGEVDVLTVSTLDAWQAGVPLIALETPPRESCGEVQARHYISYTEGRLREAIRAYEFSDAPFYSHQSVTFLPASRVAVVTHERGDRELDTHSVSVELRVLEDGVFQSRSEVTVDLGSPEGGAD